MPHPFRINIANKKTCIKSINPPAAEHHPTTITAPRMIALRLFRIENIQRIFSGSKQIKHIQVSFLMPNRKITKIMKCKSQETSVRRQTRKRNTLSFHTRVVKRVDNFSQTFVLEIERYPAKTVFHLPAILGQRIDRNRLTKI